MSNITHVLHVTESHGAIPLCGRALWDELTDDLNSNECVECASIAGHYSPELQRRWSVDEKGREIDTRQSTAQQLLAEIHGEIDVVPEPTWDTNEAILQIANTEPLYREAIATETVEAFRDTFYGAVTGVYGPNVDWPRVFHHFDDDRREYLGETTVSQMCEYFALCDRPADGTVDNPVLGPVPCCKRCAAVVGATIDPWAEVAS